MKRYLLFLGAVISALVSNSFGVSAQTLAEAESYMEQGGEMFTAGKYEEAVDLLRRLPRYISPFPEKWIWNTPQLY
jgi:hypothetical protein